VRLLAETGLPELHRLLLRGGLATLDRPAEHYGLSLVLGGGEVALLDLTNLYATLGEDGLHRPVRLLEGPENLPAASGPAERLLSPEAARVVTEVLMELRRPDLPESWDLARDAPAVAWKTGTSYGHRDAWAVGFSQELAAGVWVGNFDGTPVKGISGSRHAAPLLFDLFRALEPAAGGGRPRRPAGLRLGRIEVCPESRALPGPSCPRRLEVTYLPGRSRLAACPVHRQVLVDAKTGERLSGDCLRGRRHRFRRLTLHPAELAAWWRSQGVPVDEVPPLAPGCHGAVDGEPPKIVSPDATTPYRLRRDAPAEHQRIPLTARTDPATRRLYWYQDGVLVAATAPGEPRFLEAVPGEHRLVATDDLGRTDGVTYRVEAGEFSGPP
jgi:penicillin-binding protein 1C